MFQKLATIKETPAAIIRSWRHDSGAYRVAEIRSLYGLPTYFVAIRRLANQNEFVLGRYRKRSPAEAAIERLAAPLVSRKSAATTAASSRRRKVRR